MSVEQVLQNYLIGKHQKISAEEFCTLVERENKNKVINSIFGLIYTEIVYIQKGENADKLIDILYYLEVLITNFKNVDRNSIMRKLKGLEAELSSKIKKNNNKNIRRELWKVKEKICQIKKTKSNDSNATTEYDLVKTLANERGLSFFAEAIRIEPSLAKITDENNTPLIINAITKYLKSIERGSKKEIIYYENLISLIMSSKLFSLTSAEKEKCLSIIKNYMENKEFQDRLKGNREATDAIRTLTNRIKKHGEKKSTINQLTSKYNIKTTFNNEIEKAAGLAKIPMKGQMTDREVIDAYSISIDRSHTKQIDDCLACRKLPNGNWELIVSAASILSYFPYKSKIVQEAISRNQAIYLDSSLKENDGRYKTIFSIFPRDFSINKGPLVEGEKRFARSYIFEIDPKGNVVSERFVKSIITNNKKLSYQEANNILKNGTSNKKLFETLNNLKEVTDIIGTKIIGSDYLKSKDYSTDTSRLRVNNRESEKIVYQAKLLTGVRVGEWFARNNYPCIYKVFYEDKELKAKLQNMISDLSSMDGGDKFKELYQLVSDDYPYAWYDVKGRHDGLGVNHFVHCTSELRRAADIVLEHCLEVCYDKKPTKEELEELAEEVASKVVEINAKQSNIDNFIKEYTLSLKKTA